MESFLMLLLKNLRQNNRYKMTSLLFKSKNTCARSQEEHIQQLRVASLRRGQVNSSFYTLLSVCFLQQQASSSLILKKL